MTPSPRVAAFVYLNPSDSTTTSEVVATVNDVAITQQDIDDRIDRNRDALVAQGTNIDDPTVRAQIEEQIITQIINETLVLADAARLGLSVTAEEISAQYDTISGRFESAELFQAELEKNRFTEESLRKNVERELLTQKYIQQVTASQTVEVTEEEITALYDQLVAQSAEGAEIPELEDVQAQIEDQIRNQKLAQVVTDVIAGLKESAVIVITEKE